MNAQQLVFDFFEAERKKQADVAAELIGERPVARPKPRRRQTTFEDHLLDAASSFG